MTNAETITRERWREARAATFELQVLVASLEFGIKWISDDVRTSGFEKEFSTLRALVEDASDQVKLVAERLSEAFPLPDPGNDN